MCSNIMEGFDRRGDRTDNRLGPAKLRFREAESSSKCRKAMCNSDEQWTEKNAFVYDAIGEKKLNSDGSYQKVLKSWQKKCSDESLAILARRRQRRTPKGPTRLLQGVGDLKLGGGGGNGVNLVTGDEFPFNALEEGGIPAQVNTT